MPTSPGRGGGKRKGRRRVSEVNRRRQTPAWKTLAVNASLVAPVYGSVTFHVPQLPPGPAAMLAALTGSALATWLNNRGGTGRR
jgi:hypothetical protein